ncbi:hypothetical protein [Actinomadura fibrosa]|uniref:Secreted protein n=1 Tax=Actinomadura fibrosa TaxID=111802 RepID=A0ABW2Y5P4_9ACTN|nr:hypothetical protein [Actinomadura fibrosa]
MAFVVPVLVATVVAFALRDPASERPESGGTVQQLAPISPGPEPTFGQYVPPEAKPQAETRLPDRPPATAAPKPTGKPKGSASPKATGTPTPEMRPRCPEDWREVPWWRFWCRRHGPGTR